MTYSVTTLSETISDMLFDIPFDTLFGEQFVLFGRHPALYLLAFYLPSLLAYLLTFLRAFHRRQSRKSFCQIIWRELLERWEVPELRWCVKILERCILAGRMQNQVFVLAFILVNKMSN